MRTESCNSILGLLVKLHLMAHGAPKHVKELVASGPDVRMEGAEKALTEKKLVTAYQKVMSVTKSVQIQNVMWQNVGKSSASFKVSVIK